MDQPLREALEKARLAAGHNGRPLGYEAWGESLGIMYTSLFRFAKGKGALGIKVLRRLAQIAKDTEDNEMIQALAVYALDIQLSAKISGPVDN